MKGKRRKARKRMGGTPSDDATTLVPPSPNDTR